MCAGCYKLKGQLVQRRELYGTLLQIHTKTKFGERVGPNYKTTIKSTGQAMPFSGKNNNDLQDICHDQQL
jgi:hypothetical protein